MKSASKSNCWAIWPKLIAQFVLILSSQADVVVREEFTADATKNGWAVFGDQTLFQQVSNRLGVTWNSSRTNSSYYLRLPFALDDADEFQFECDLVMDDIAIGTTPGKPYTFELALGFFNLGFATNSSFYRGSGIDAVHGARNVVEFNYFPDSGFGATIAPTIATSANRIYFSDNHPYELTSATQFHLRMRYDPTNRMLRTEMLREGEPFPAEGLRDLALPTGAVFVLDSIGFTSYSDAGQNPPQFSGSILAHGQVDNVELRLPDPPVARLEIRKVSESIEVSFSAKSNWFYRLEKSDNLLSWVTIGNASKGISGRMVLSDAAARKAFYRVQASKTSVP